MQSYPTRLPGLRLRPFASTDAERLARIAGVHSVVQFTLGIPLPYSVAAAKDWIAGLPERNASQLEWILAICWRGHLVGSVGLTLESEHRRAELGYWLGEDYRQRGFATAAIERCCQRAFEELELARIYALCFPENGASQHLLRKLGFKKEGRLRAHVVKDNVAKDAIVFGLLAKDSPHLVGL
jgi:[ribosomal protein S5]-alanine N-acetyltransferase